MEIKNVLFSWHWVPLVLSLKEISQDPRGFTFRITLRNSSAPARGHSPAGPFGIQSLYLRHSLPTGCEPKWSSPRSHRGRLPEGREGSESGGGGVRPVVEEGVASDSGIQAELEPGGSCWKHQPAPHPAHPPPEGMGSLGVYTHPALPQHSGRGFGDR